MHKLVAVVFQDKLLVDADTLSATLPVEYERLPRVDQDASLNVVTESFLRLLSTFESEEQPFATALVAFGLIQQRRFSEAEGIVKILTSENRVPGLASQIQWALLSATGESRKACDALLEMQATPMSRTAKATLYGYLRFHLNDWAEAITHFELSCRYAAQDLPDFVLRHHALALNRLNRREDSERALAQLECLKSTVMNVTARLEVKSHWIGLLIKENSGKFSKRISGLNSALNADIHAALKWFPESSYLRLIAGKIYRYQKNFAAAESVLRQAIALEPSSARAQFQLGELFVWQKRWVEAVSCFQEAVRLNPKNGRYELALAGAQKNAGNSMAALEHGMRSVAIDPRKDEAFAVRAEAYDARGEDEAAEIARENEALTRRCRALNASDYFVKMAPEFRPEFEEILTQYLRFLSERKDDLAYLIIGKLRSILDRVFHQVMALSGQMIPGKEPYYFPILWEFRNKANAAQDPVFEFEHFLFPTGKGAKTKQKYQASFRGSALYDYLRSRQPIVNRCDATLRLKTLSDIRNTVAHAGRPALPTDIGTLLIALIEDVVGDVLNCTMLSPVKT